MIETGVYTKIRYEGHLNIKERMNSKRIEKVEDPAVSVQNVPSLSSLLLDIDFAL